MSRDRSKSLILTLAFSLSLALVLLLLLSSATGSAKASGVQLFVKADGAGTICTQAQPCQLDTAIEQATIGTTVYLAGETYAGHGAAVITITESITLFGGWDGTTATPVLRDPDLYPTIVDGQTWRRTVFISGTISPIVDGLTLKNGDATGLGGDPSGFDAGGALYVNRASPLIVNCHISNSIAEFGGGAAFFGGAPTIRDNIVQDNVVSHRGSGIYLHQSSAAIINNQLIDNFASGTGLFDGGAGLYMDNSPALLQRNIFSGNFSQSQGGGLYIFESAPIVSMNNFYDNRAENGGGLFMLQSPAFIDGNYFSKNRADVSGGGLSVIGSDPFSMKNNIVNQNYAAGPGAGLFVAGYEPTAGPGVPADGELLHNTFAENNSPATPWMVWAELTATLTMKNTLFGQPGGVWVDAAASVHLDTTLFDWPLQAPGLSITGTGAILNFGAIYGDPDFIGPVFHIGPNSAAINAGAFVGVLVDIDEQFRPNGPAPDIGADEYWPRFMLPIIRNDDS